MSEAEGLKKGEWEFRIVPFSKVRKWDEVNVRRTNLTEGLDELDYRETQ